jgi:hypothetical protein
MHRMLWLRGDVMAQGMRWLSGLIPRGDTRLKMQQSRVRIRHSTKSPERGQETLFCIIKQILVLGGVPG